jgi:BlaI family penicillinase repressor
MGNKLLDVGPLEMEVLGILNTIDECAVAEIQTQLKQNGHDLAYTTVMTVLVRLTNKGLVSRRKEGRQFIYSAAQKRRASPLRVFEKVKMSLFGNEKLKPILSLLDAEDGLSRSELEQLKNAVEAKLKGK